MNRFIRNLALFGGGFVLLSFAVFVVNQTAQVVQLAETLQPGAGKVTLLVLLSGYGLLVAVPIVKVLRLPPALVPPASREGPRYQAHMKELGRRLGTNRELAGLDLRNEAGILAALARLDGQADQIVRETATRVFLATAVSQSGRLDTFLVLSMQTGMVWRIARLYYQRPTPRDLVHLYANVAGTAFVAGELSDLDLSEQIEPIFSAVLGSLGGAVPGLQLASSILANSILSGAGDAFLTLRVGMIARRCCGALAIESPSSLRREATSEAAGMLAGIVAEGSKKLTAALWRNSRDKATVAVGDLGSRLTSVFEKVVDKVKKRDPSEATV